MLCNLSPCHQFQLWAREWGREEHETHLSKSLRRIRRCSCTRRTRSSCRRARSACTRRTRRRTRSSCRRARCTCTRRSVRSDRRKLELPHIRPMLEPPLLHPMVDCDENPGCVMRLVEPPALAPRKPTTHTGLGALAFDVRGLGQELEEPSPGLKVRVRVAHPTSF